MGRAKGVEGPKWTGLNRRGQVTAGGTLSCRCLGTIQLKSRMPFVLQTLF